MITEKQTWNQYKKDILTEEESKLPIALQRFLIMKRYFDSKGGEKYLLNLIDNIKEWNYEQYINQDPIWKTIKNFSKYISPACGNCELSYNLEAHHLSYNHLGTELYHLEDIIVYCGKCHFIYTILYRASRNTESVKSIRSISPKADIHNILQLLKDNHKDLYEMVQA